MNQLRQVLQLFCVYRRHLGGRIYIVLCLTFAAVLVESIGITMLLPLFLVLDGSGQAGEVEMDGITAAIREALARVGLEESVAGIVGIIALLFFIRALAKLAEGAYKGYLESELMRTTKGKLFQLLGSMDYRFYTGRNTGHFVNLVSVQVANFVSTSYTFLAFGIGVVAFLGYLAAAFVVSPPFTLMAAAAGLGILAALKGLSDIISRYSRLDAEEQGTLNKLMIQTVQAYKYLAATATLGPLGRALDKSIGKLARYMFRKNLATSFTDAVREPLAMAVVLVIVVIQISFLGGGLAAIMVAVLLIYRAMTQLGAMQMNWQKTLGRIGSIEVVERELAEISASQESQGGQVMGPFADAIALQNISFSYGKEGSGPVLKEIDLRIEALTTVGLVGESGAGKSTLVDILCLLLTPDTGKMLIDGVSVDAINRHSWRSQIGYVSQETVVFDDTVANNICLWAGDSVADPGLLERIRRAAREAHALDFIEDLPEGFQTMVGDRGIRLSGGQRQRLFIARELFKQPRLLILDEATSALDSGSEQAIQASIDALKGRLTVVIIAHRLSTVREADRIFVLEDGCLVESGTFEELREIPGGLFRKMVEKQQL